MKRLLIQIYSTISTLYYSLCFKSLRLNHGLIFKTMIKGTKKNNILIDKSELKRSQIQIQGNNNQIILQQCHFDKTNILMIGNNNIIHIDPEVRINSTHIILRGNNCRITIGQGTTFGSAYIVCMGNSNYIQIGEQCMFAEDIEIWNTDSHPIFDNKGLLINPSNPINIGNHVWCGKGCKILKGVSIGNNAVIGMGALVTKDFAPNTLNVGVPAHTIKNGINWDRNFITK